MPIVNTADKIEAKASWLRWRRILDTITGNPGYRYGDPKARLLLKLADHAMRELGRFNTLVWRGVQTHPEFPRGRRLLAESRLA